MVVQRLRYQAAADALVAVRDDLRGKIPPRHKGSAQAYSTRLIDADDEFGARAGLVTQRDQLAWSTVDAMYDLAKAGGRAHQAETGHAAMPGCEICAGYTAVGSVQIADALAARRRSPVRKV
jgi:hypothetical protein